MIESGRPLCGTPRPPNVIATLTLHTSWVSALGESSLAAPTFLSRTTEPPTSILATKRPRGWHLCPSQGGRWSSEGKNRKRRRAPSGPAVEGPSMSRARREADPRGKEAVGGAGRAGGRSTRRHRRRSHREAGAPRPSGRRRRGLTAGAKGSSKTARTSRLIEDKVRGTTDSRQVLKRAKAVGPFIGRQEDLPRHFTIQFGAPPLPASEPHSF